MKTPAKLPAIQFFILCFIMTILSVTSFSFGQIGLNTVEAVLSYSENRASRIAQEETLQRNRHLMEKEGITPFAVGEFDLNTSTIEAYPKVIPVGISKSLIRIELKNRDGGYFAGDVIITGLDDLFGGTTRNTLVSTYLGNGIYEVRVSTLTAGADKNIGFTVNGVVAQDKTEITYQAGAPDLRTSSFTTDKYQMKADGEDSATIRLTLMDGHLNRLKYDAGEVALAFDSNGGKGYGTTVDGTNRFKHLGEGVYEIKLKSTTGNISDQIRFTLNGVKSGRKAISIDYLQVNEIDYTKSTVKVSPQVLLGTDAATVTVQLKDPFGHDLMVGDLPPTVQLVSTEDQLGTFSNNGVLTYKGAGLYEGTIRADTALEGEDILSFEVSGGKRFTQKASLLYTLLAENRVSSTSSYISFPGYYTTHHEIIDADTDATKITVVLRGARGVAINGSLIKVYLTGLEYGHSKSGSNEMIYQGNGVYTLDIASKKVGTDQLGFEFSENGGERIAGAQTKPLIYYSEKLDVEQSTVIVTPNSLPLDGLSRAYAEVQLRDQYGNKITQRNSASVSLKTMSLGVCAISERTSCSLTAHGEGYFTVELQGKHSGTEELTFDIRSYRGEGELKREMTYTQVAFVSAAKSHYSHPWEKVTIPVETGETSIIVNLKDEYGGIVNDDYSDRLSVTGLVHGRLATVNKIGHGQYELIIKATAKAGRDDFQIYFDQDEIKTGSGWNNYAYIIYEAPKLTEVHESLLATSELIIEEAEQLVGDSGDRSRVIVKLQDTFGNLYHDSSNPPKLLIDGDKVGSYSRLSFYENIGYVATVYSSKSGVNSIDFSYRDVAKNVPKIQTFIADTVDIQRSGFLPLSDHQLSIDDSEVILTVQLRDQYHNPLTAGIPQKVEIVGNHLVPLKGVLSATVNNQDGTYSAKVRAKSVGRDTFYLKIDGVYAARMANYGVSTSTYLDYLVGEFSLPHSEIKISPTHISANTTESALVEVWLRDQSGMVIDIPDVVVMLTGAQETVQGNISLTRRSTGYFTTNLSMESVGSADIGFSVDGVVAKGDKSQVRLTAHDSEISYDRSTIVLSKKEIEANGEELVEVTITTRHHSGSLLDKPFDVELDGLKIGELVGELSSEGEGVYKGEIRSTALGNEEIGFKVNGVVAKNRAPIKYLAGAVDYTKSTAYLESETLVANGYDHVKLYVQLRDSQGRDLNYNYGAGKITIDRSALAATNVSSYSSYLTDGLYYFDIYARSLTGTENLPVFVGDEEISKGEVNITFLPKQLSIYYSTISFHSLEDDSEITRIVADNEMKVLVRVRLNDSSRNMIADLGEVSLTGVNNGEIVSPMRKIEAGVYEGIITSRKSGNDTIGFKVAGFNEVKPGVTFNYIAGPAAPEETKIVFDGNYNAEIKVNNYSYIHIYFYDKYGNLAIAPNEGEVTFSELTLGRHTISRYNNETYRGYVYAPTDKVGNETLSVYLKGVKTAEQAFTYVNYGGANPSNSTISVEKDWLKADGKDSTIITIQLKDSYGADIEGNPMSVWVSGLKYGAMDDTLLTPMGGGRYQGILTSKKDVEGKDTLYLNLEKGGSSWSTPVVVRYGKPIVYTPEVTFDRADKTILADYKDALTVNVTFKDDEGNLLADNLFDVWLEGLSKGTTNRWNYANGVYTTTIVSEYPGEDSAFYLTYRDKTYSDTIKKELGEKITYKVGTFDDLGSGTYLWRASSQPVEANGASTLELRVIPFYKSGYRFREYPGEIELYSLKPEVIGSVKFLGVNSYGEHRFAVGATTEIGEDLFAYKIDGVLMGEDKPVKVEYYSSLPRGTMALNPARIDADGVDVSEVMLTLTTYEGIPITNAKDLIITQRGGTQWEGEVKLLEELPGGIYRFSLSAPKGKTSPWHYLGFKLGDVIGRMTSDQYLIYNAGEGIFDEETLEITVVDEKREITADNNDYTTVSVKAFYASAPEIPLAGIHHSPILERKDGQNRVGRMTYWTESPAGTYHFRVYSEKPGSDDFVFKTRAKTSEKSTGDITYRRKIVMGDFLDSASSIEVTNDKTRIDADGIDTINLTVKLFRDESRQDPIVDYDPDNLVVMRDGGALKGDLTFIDESPLGHYNYELRTQKVGEEILSFKTNVGKSQQFVILQYNAGDGLFADDETLQVTATKNTILADGKDTANLAVTLYYASNPDQLLTDYLHPQFVLEDGTPSQADIEFF